TPVRKGVLTLLPIVFVGAVLGIFMFTTIGAALGAYDAGAGHPTATPLRAFLGGVIGMLPAGSLEGCVRHPAHKSIWIAMVVRVYGLSLAGLAGLIGFGTGSLQPQHGYNALVHRGYQRYSGGDWNGAIADFSKAIELEPEEQEAYWGRSLVLGVKGNRAEADKDWERCSELEKAREVRQQKR